MADLPQPPRKCIELIPPERLSFLLAEMHGSAVAAARHRYGAWALGKVLGRTTGGLAGGFLQDLTEFWMQCYFLRVPKFLSF